MDGYDFVWKLFVYGLLWFWMDISLFHFQGLVRNSS